MAKDINPKWYPDRSCFRSRRKINGKTKTFLGGYGGTGSKDPKAYYRAVEEISGKIAKAEAANLDAEVEQERQVDSMIDFIVLEDARTKATAQALQSLNAGEAPPSIPMMDELRELKQQIQELQETNAIQAAQLLAVGQQYKSESLDLQALAEKYIATQTKQARTEGKHSSTICEYKNSTLKLMKFLAENKVTTTAQLEQSSAVVGEYRDYWVDRISDGASSHSLAKKSLSGARSFFEWLAQREYISRMPPAIGSKFATVGVDESSKQFLTLAEARKLFKASSPRLQLIQLMGYNAGYRAADCISLELKTIDLKKGIILRQRNKTAAAQPTKLWPITLKLLKQHLATLPKGADPFSKGYTNISREMSKFMREHVSQEPNKRTAKAFRSTAAQQLEKLLKGKEPKTVSMFLAHGSKDQAKAYRNSDTQGLFEATDALCKVFKLAD